MDEFIKQASPYILGLIVALITWFYSLIEKRINARQKEHHDLKEEVNALKTEVAVLKNGHTLLSKTLEDFSKDFKSHLDDKISSLEKLLTAQFSQTK
jgi:ribosome-binding ATPase YchF (GTP1/OBG family)